jgi:catechol 2,3-dioxygenase-like lactoylglutathione lyase family enzyme
MRRAFASLGLPADYGGPHANGVTHMALLGFEDGSYLELIAPLKPIHTSGLVSGWDKLMAGNAGACAWAIATTDIRKEVERLNTAGIRTRGPEPGGRKKPDGTQISWETASIGEGAPGANLPFMIADKTPRNLRAQASAGLKGTGLTGIAVVVLGVTDLDSAIALYRKAYAWPEPKIEDHKDFGSTLAYFPGTPVVLAAPLDQTSWLAERLNKFEGGPVAYLLGTSDFRTATTKFKLTNSTEWFHRNVAWFDQDKLLGVRIGLVQ